jgi:hypothetical protein
VPSDEQNRAGSREPCPQSQKEGEGRGALQLSPMEQPSGILASVCVPVSAHVVCLCVALHTQCCKTQGRERSSAQHLHLLATGTLRWQV